ncbi:MAG: hypothetical protein M1822_003564 [Bathelium mastoideum]|nr:MAG: hypothetical protein M1822_003564 [Bathelium mastoideum]
MANSNKPSPAFLQHLSFFASSQQPNIITFTSALKSSLALGLNFPVSCILSLGLRALYSPSWLLLSPPNLQKLGTNHTQLEQAELTQSTYTRRELQGLVPSNSSLLDHLIDRGHVLGLWVLAADTRTGLVKREDVEEFQKGTLMQRLAERRKTGRNDILPFYRGGPISVAGHSWMVRKMLGVRVYEDE